MSVRNLQHIRNKDPKLYEALRDIIQQHTTLAQQVNGNGLGNPNPPPSVSSVNVSGRDGFMHVAISDQNPIYRGVRYFAEHADNPHFTNPQIVPMGDSRNVNIPIGNQTRYVRVYSSYISSPPSSAVYHGSQTQPLPVQGGGPGPGPDFLPSEGSGTGVPSQGLTGPGITPFRSTDGIPPTR